MQNSRSIKQSITNSQLQTQQKQSSFKIPSPCSSTKQRQQGILQFIPEQYHEQNNDETESNEQMYRGQDNGFAERSMFTIRQEQSYEYQSEQSRCKKAVKCESYIDHLSTIKAQNHNHHNTDQRVSNFEPTCYQKMQENATMSTLHYNRMASQEIISERIEGWDSKISAKLSGIELFQEEEVQQEDIIVLKQSEKALNLDLSKNHMASKPFQKIIKNVDIAYTCADQEFYQIMKILERQGIKVIENPKKHNLRQKQNYKTRGIVENKPIQKKIKLKIMKIQNKMRCQRA